MSPYLKSWMIAHKDEINSGFYKKRSAKEMGAITFTLWLVVIVCALAALVLTGTNESQEMAQIDRKEVMARQWDGTSGLGWWTARELFILRESRPGTSARHLDAIYMAERR